MEQYGLDVLAASAEAVVPGLGPLAAGLGRLAGEAGRAVTLDAMEVCVPRIPSTALTSRLAIPAAWP